jgi:hypothetical protein
VSPRDGEPGASGKIAQEITTLRDEIGELVNELDRRRRDAFDVRLQMKRHPVATYAGVVAVAAILGGSVALLVYNGRRKERASYKAKQLKVAVRRMVEHPERVARGEAPPGEKILAAVGTALATLLVKRAFDKAVPRPQVQAAPPQGDARSKGGRPQPRPQPARA